jgi:hypothetical protein
MTLKLHMKPFLAAAVAALLPWNAALAVAPERRAPIYREGEVLVRYRAQASDADIQSAKSKLGLAARRSIDRRRTELLALPAFTTTAAALEVLRADPTVEHAEPNFRRFRRAVVPDDTLFPQQWALWNTGQASFGTGPAGTPGADLNMTNAWDADNDGTADRTGDPSVIVAVIDDAIQVAHPDLAPNMLPGRNFIACQNASNPSPVSSAGQHGTWVSGCVAGRGNNGSGVAGVAWNTSLMPLKFGFDTATHLQAIEYARDNGADIINASFGGPGFSQLEADLIASLAADDILYVAAAGNDDSNTDVARLTFPANYDADNIVAVAATNRQDDIASFSQYGPISTDVAAPGLEVVTTQFESIYATAPGVSGTSFSSPYTAGVAALLKAHVTPAPGFLEMKARLIESGTSVAGANPRRMTSGGRVDADAALDMTARPALVITGVTFDDGGNGVPDPGETLDVSFAVRNLWQGATNVTATLAVDDADVTVDSGQQALGAIAALGTATATFQVTVADGITEHRYLTFTLSLAADGGYAAQRSARAELGTLALGATVNQSFTTGGYDDFHAWHVDVPDGSNKTLFLRTTTAVPADIDLLGKHQVPPQYNITVGINPELQFGFFCTSGTEPDCEDPGTEVSARLDGVEEVSIVNPAAGTYHAVVVNFAQMATPLAYTLEAELVDGDLRPDPFDFVPVGGAPPSTLVTSSEVLIRGISAPAPVTVTGGTYRIDDGVFTAQPGTIANNQRLRLQALTGGLLGAARVQVTVGGVTRTWLVNDQVLPTGIPSEEFCPRDTSGRMPLPALLLFAIAALARRRRAA